MKHGMSVVLVTLLLLSLLLPCALAEDASLAIVKAEQNTEDLGLEINIVSDFADADKVDNYKVTLGGNVLNIQSVTASDGTHKAEEESTGQLVIPSNDSGTSWVFLVDISTVATDSTPYKLTATLDSLFGLIGTNDNAALVNTAMTYGPEYLTEETGSLRNQVKNGVTNFDQSANRLYDAVIKSLDFLESNENAKAFKSLVVLSKGDNKNGNASLEDVLNRIEASNVAVYTIAYINSSTSRDFGEMAQVSIDKGHGGAVINLDTVGSAQIQDEAASIIRYVERKRKREAGGYVAPTSTSTSPTEYVIKTDQPKEAGVDQTVVVSFKNGDQTTNTAYVVSGSIIYPKKSFFEWLITGIKRGDIACVGIVAGVAVLIALIVVLLIRKLGKKKNRQESQNYNAGEVVPPPVFDANQSATAAATTPTSAVDSPQRKRLQLSLREASGKNYRAMLTTEGITAGRQGDNHVVLDSDDKHISRHHFMMKLVDDDVILENISETNGLYVNGMRIEGPIALRQQDIIRVGGTEMTVTWKYV